MNRNVNIKPSSVWWNFISFKGKLSSIVFVFFLLLSCSQKQHESYTVFCDAEVVATENKAQFFKTSQYSFSNGQTQSAEKFLSGKYSSKLTTENKSGMCYTFEDLHSGDVLKINVWICGTKQNSTIAIEGDWGGKVFVGDSIESKNGWFLLKAIYTVGGNNVNVSVYPFLKQVRDTIYADDFQITYIPASDEAELSIPEGEDVFSISISQDEMEKLEKRREAALKKGILISRDEDWVSANIQWQKDTLSAKLRLKGDWTDHLKGRKWSYRIKLKNEKEWNGMKVFSIQNPQARYYLHEWIIHKLLQKENILSPVYGFVYVKQNGKSLGLYAYEEHFTAEMLERNHREKGIIVCFSEEEMWNDRAKNDGKDRDYVPYLEASEIKAFSTEEEKKDSKYLNEFVAAQWLMEQYKYRDTSLSKIFNIEQLAKYLALLDICGSQHGLIWHNQRMYFNPNTSLLEPIGFDAYTDQGSLSLSGQPFWGAYGISNFSEANEFQYSLFRNPHLYEKYIFYLEQYSSEEYLHEFTKPLSSEIEKYSGFIKLEQADYHFTTDYLFKNAAAIRIALSYFKKNNLLPKNIELLNSRLIVHTTINHSIEAVPIENISVKAYVKNKSKEERSIYLQSFHIAPIEVIGTGDDMLETSFANPILLPAFSKGKKVEYIEAKISSEGKNVFYKVEGKEEMYKQALKKELPLLLLK